MEYSTYFRLESFTYLYTDYEFSFFFQYLLEYIKNGVESQ